MIRRYVLPIALPVAVIGGYVLAASIGGFVDDAWQGFLGPFLLAYWIGFGFTLAWDYVREGLHLEGAAPVVAAITGVLGALLILSMLGGVAALIEDPWLFGVAIAPGLQLALPWLRRHRAESGNTGAS